MAYTTNGEIIEHFLDLPNHDGNWGTGWDNSKWVVSQSNTHRTYINGVMVTVDMDYYMGYVIEVCDEHYRLNDPSKERTNTVWWFAIVVFHGKGPNGWDYTYNMFHTDREQTFYERDVKNSDIHQWGVKQIDETVAIREFDLRREIKEI